MRGCARIGLWMNHARRDVCRDLLRPLRIHARAALPDQPAVRLEGGESDLSPPIGCEAGASPFHLGKELCVSLHFFVHTNRGGGRGGGVGGMRGRIAAG